MASAEGGVTFLIGTSMELLWGKRHLSLALEGEQMLIEERVEKVLL